MGIGIQPTDRLVTIPKAGKLTGVSRRTIYNWLKSGKLQFVRTAGGSIRIFEDSLWRDPNDPDVQRQYPWRKV